jgi:hypothetical protein
MCQQAPASRQVMPASILSLSETHLRILKALHAATRILRMQDHLTIIGGLARFFAGEVRHVGDVDVLIAKPLCQLYWEFLEVLSYHGIVSLFDVLDRPPYPWRFCRPGIVAHARALTADCAASLAGHTHANLDICFCANDLDSIPYSQQWVREAKVEELKQKNAEERKRIIEEGHRAFTEERRNEYKTLPNLGVHPDLGLRYAWGDPSVAPPNQTLHQSGAT